MNPVVLIIAEEDDWHAEAVSALLKKNGSVRVVRLAMSQFPSSSRCTFTLDNCPHYWWKSNGAQLHSEDVLSVWWRRPERCAVERIYSESLEFIQSECDHFLQGVLFSTNCSWINDPMANLRASRKVVQLSVASQAALNVPRTVISNDQDDVKQFLASLGPGRQAIFKRVATVPGVLTKTTLLSSTDSEDLSSIATCPAIFQEYITPRCDLRIIYIDGFLWVVEIDVAAGKHPEDSRFDHTVPYKEHPLPSTEADKICAFMQKLGLRYGAIDVRLGLDDKYYFLEVNPSGQFAYLQMKTGLPIIESLVEALLRRPSSQPVESSTLSRQTC